MKPKQYDIELRYKNTANTTSFVCEMCKDAHAAKNYCNHKIGTCQGYLRCSRPPGHEGKHVACGSCKGSHPMLESE